MCLEKLITTKSIVVADNTSTAFSYHQKAECRVLRKKNFISEFNTREGESPIPASGKVSMNIIISSPVRPDKKQIRGNDWAICRAKHKHLHVEYKS